MAEDEHLQRLTPYLIIRDAASAIDFYKTAFGAKELYRLEGPDGKSIMHAEMEILGSKFMLGDEHPGMGALSPSTTGNTSSGIHIYVDDCDMMYKAAINAGAKSLFEPQDMFWGDRYAKILDPFGHMWSLGTPKEELTPEEIRKRGHDAMKQAAGKK